MVSHGRAEEKIQRPGEKAQIEIEVGNRVIAAKKPVVLSKKRPFLQHPEGTQRSCVERGEIVLKIKG